MDTSLDPWVYARTHWPGDPTERFLVTPLRSGRGTLDNFAQPLARAVIRYEGWRTP